MTALNDPCRTPDARGRFSRNWIVGGGDVRSARRRLMAVLRKAHRVLGMGRERLGLGALSVGGHSIGAVAAVALTFAVALTGTNGAFAYSAGAGATADQNEDTAVGNSANADGVAGGPYAVAIGFSTNAAGNGTYNLQRTDGLGFSDASPSYGGTAVGGSAVASNSGSAFGSESEASGLLAVAVGNNATSTGTSSAAFGPAAYATATHSLAVGFQNLASGTRSTAIGPVSTASGTDSTAIGTSASASGSRALAFGASPSGSVGQDTTTNTQASGDDSIAFGTSATAPGNRATAIGLESNAAGPDSVAIGSGASAGANNPSAGDGGTALGYEATAHNSSTALGAGARTTASNAIAIGSRQAFPTIASGDGAIAFGNIAEAQGVTSIAIGRQSTSSADGAIAMGQGASASGAGSLALGGDSAGFDGLDGAKATADSAIALGIRSSAAASGSLAMGDGANVAAAANDGVAVGTDAAANAANDIAMGNAATATGNAAGSAVAIGAGNQASGAGAVALGDPSIANGNGAIAQGLNSTATGNGTVALGNTAQAGGGGQGVGTPGTAAQGTVSIGYQTQAVGQGSVALGNASTATGAGSLAFGDGATAGNANDVALGSGSTTAAAVGTAAVTINGTSYDFAGTTPGSTVSVGSDGAERTITNVAAGRLSQTSTDAVNGSQLYATNQAVEAPITFAGNTGGNVERTLGETVNITGGEVTGGSYSGDNLRTVADGTDGIEIQMTDQPDFGGVVINDGGTQKITGLEDGDVNATSTDAVNGSQLAAVSDVANAGFDLTAEGANSTNVGPGDAVDLSNTDGNIVVAKTTADNNVTFDLAPDIGVDSVTLTSGQVFDSTGLDMNDTQITGLTDGAVNATSNDAVNGSQLYGVSQSVADNLGGGSTVDTDGTITSPTYNIQGNTYNNVGDGFDAVDNSITDLSNTIDATATHYYSVNDGGTNGGNYDNDGASGLNAVAAGVGAAAAGDNATALGTNSSAGGDDALALGNGAEAGGNGAIGIGTGNVVAGAGSGAFGSNNTVAQDDTFVMGSDVTTSQANSVVLGNASTDRAATAETGITINGGTYAFAGVGSAANGVVSVGSAGAERQIINVAAGDVSGTSTDAVNGSQLFATNQAVEAVATTANQGFNVTAEGANSTNVAPGETVDFNSDDGNIVVSKADDSDDVTFDLNDDIAVDSVTAGDTVLDTDGLSFNVADSPSITATGIDSGGNKITNVADGDVNDTSTDAVNGSQLYGVSQSVADNLGGGSTVNPDGTITNPNYTIEGNTYTNVGDGFDAVDNSITDLSNTIDATATHYYSVNDGGTDGGNYDNDGASGLNALAAGVDAAASVEDSVALGSGAISDRALTTGSGTLPDGFVTYNTEQGTLLGAVSVGDGTAGNESYRQITNVADGTELHDAVTIQQLGNAILAASETDTKYFHASSTAPDSVAGGTDSIAVGPNTVVNGANSIGMGNHAVVNAPGGTAIGQDSSVGGTDGIAMGTQSQANGDQSIALGAGAQSDDAASVALGSNSVTDAAVGTDSTTINGTSYDFAGEAPVGTVSVGDTDAERTITNVAAGRVTADSTDAINGSQLYATNTAIENLATDIGDVGDVAENAIQYDTDSAGDRTNSVTLQGGDPNAPVVIHNVGRGVDDNDAVNVAQLDEGVEETKSYTDDRVDYAIDTSNNYTDRVADRTLSNANDYTDQRFDQLNQNISGVRSEARQAAAIGLAAASLRFDDRPGKLSVAMGGGYWQSESALAFGAGYTSENGRVRANLTGTTAGGDWGVGAGVSFTLN